MRTKMKLILFLLVALTAQANARFAFNHPASVNVQPTNAIPVPTYFTSGKVGLTVNGRVLNNIDGFQYAHLGILNEAKYPISVAFSSDGSSTGISLSEKLYVASSGTAVFDDISVFQAIYLMSEEGGSITDGKIKIMVW